MTSILQVLEQNPALLITFVTLLGLVVGSFLNVVIYRLPLIELRAWRKECAEELDCEDKLGKEVEETFNLAYPPSHCPKCQHKIRLWENIPILSYLLQKGRCTSCKEPISMRYPVVELSSALLALACALYFGFSAALIGALLLSWVLLALSLIDFDHTILPDSMTLPLLWLGLLFNLFGVFTSLESAVIGAMAGYLSLWSIYWLFKLITGKEGMGYGDFKLFAALGAWMGWQLLPLIILLSSAVGAVLGITMMLILGRDRNIPIPFGPYLAAAGWIALLWGGSIMQAYLGGAMP